MSSIKSLNFKKLFALRILKKSSKNNTAWIICSIGALFYCYEYLLRIAPGAMLMPLMKDFNLHAETLGAIISLFYLSYSPLQLFVGLAHDIFGPHHILTIAVGFCLIGSLLFGLAHSPFTISIARLLIGFGGAFAFVGALKLGILWLPRKYFVLFVGLTTSLGMLGGMFGNIAITLLTKQIGWRAIYLWGAVLGVVLMAAMWWVMEDPTSKSQKKLLRIIKSSQTRKQLLKIFTNYQLWLTAIIASLLYLSLSALAELWGNKFVQQAYGFSTNDAATINAMIFLGWLIGSPLVGWLAARIQQYRFLIRVSSFLAGIICLLILFFRPESVLGAQLLFFLLGIFCSAQTLCIALTREEAPTALSATAIGFINCIIMLGGLIFQPLIGHLLDFYWTGEMHDHIRLYSAETFSFALSVLPIGFFLACILSFFLPERKKKFDLLQKSFTRLVSLIKS